MTRIGSGYCWVSGCLEAATGKAQLPARTGQGGRLYWRDVCDEHNPALQTLLARREHLAGAVEAIAEAGTLAETWGGVGSGTIDFALQRAVWHLTELRLELQKAGLL